MSSCSLFRPARVFVLFFCALAWHQSAVSAPLAPGSSVYNPAVAPTFTPSYTLGGVPSGLSGYSFLTSQTVPYDYTPNTPNEAYFGSVTSTIYTKNDLSGKLAFSYAFNNLVPPTAPDNTHDFDINHFTVGGTANAWVGVGILDEGADGSGNSTPVGSPNWNNGNPFVINRANNPGDQGIGLFLSQFGAGTLLQRGTAATPLNNTSALVWFTTDATSFTTTNVGLQDGQSTVGASSAYAPVVPEPSALLLLAMGSVGIALMARRARGR